MNLLKKRRNGEGGEAFVLLLMCVLACVATGQGCYETGYEQGQIDALSGKAVWYRLETQDDGSVKWVEQREPATRPAVEE